MLVMSHWHREGMWTVGDGIDHMARLLYILQLLSRVLTNLLHTKHVFFAEERDAGLSTVHLIVRPQVTLKDLPGGPAGQEARFRPSQPDTDARFWAAHVHSVLERYPKLLPKMGPAVPQYLAVAFRYNTVGRMATRLLAVVEACGAQCAAARRNNVVHLLKTKLRAFVRRKPQGAPAHADFDTQDVLARELHLHRFAGPLWSLDAKPRARYDAVVAEMTREFGADACEIVVGAAFHAGERLEAEFAHVPSSTEHESSSLGAPQPGKATPACGWLLLEQLPLLRALCDALYDLNLSVREERTFGRAVDAWMDASTQTNSPNPSQLFSKDVPVIPLPEPAALVSALQRA